MQIYLCDINVIEILASQHINAHAYTRVFVPLRSENDDEEDEGEGEDARAEGLARCICRPGLKSGY